MDFPQPQQISKGDHFEVIDHDDSYKGSYYTGVIMSNIVEEQCKVRLDNVKDIRTRRHVRKMVSLEKLRPTPYKILAWSYAKGQAIHVYHRHRWWSGLIVSCGGEKYMVYYPALGIREEHTFDQLLIHQQWSGDGF